MTSYVRGSKLFFSAAVVDKDGAPASPSGATLYLVYTDLDSVRDHVEVTMDVAGNVVSAEWDSSVAAAPQSVYWSVKATGSNAIVQDGNLNLTANEANPTP